MRRERAAVLGIILIADEPHLVADLPCLFLDPVQELRMGIPHLARGHLAQGRDHGLIVPIVHQDLRSLENLAGPLTCQDHEGKAVSCLFQRVFNGNSCHIYMPPDRSKKGFIFTIMRSRLHVSAT
jgi:hypothetical protein